MENINKLDYLEIVPNIVNNVFILLHGYGTDKNDLLCLALSFKKILPNTAFILVNAPYKVDIGDCLGYQWFSLRTMNLFSILKEVRIANKILNNFIDEQLKRFSLNDNNLLLGGFSQGAIMSLYNGFRRKSAPMGILAFSGMIPDTFSSLEREIKCKPETLLIHGRLDKVVPYANFEKTEKILKEFDIPLETHLISDMAHEINDKALQYSLEFIKKICNKI